MRQKIKLKNNLELENKKENNLEMEHNLDIENKKK